MGTIAIAERSQEGHPMVMVMNSQRMISIQSKKRGKRYDYSHDLDEYGEANPLIAQEIFDRGGDLHAPMSEQLKSFVEDMWDMAQELDPWYITDPSEEEELN